MRCSAPDLQTILYSGTYREDYNNVLLTVYNDGKVEADFEANEGFMDEDVLDGRGWNEASGCGR